MASEPYMATFDGTGSFVPVSASQMVMDATFLVSSKNASVTEFRVDGSQVAKVQSGSFALLSVDLSRIEVKSAVGDTVSVIAQSPPVG